MGGQVLVVVSSADVSKSSLAIRWAAVAARERWVDRVEVALFGPVEDALARGSPPLEEALNMAREAGVPVVACINYARAGGYEEKLAGKVPLEFVGKIIGERVSQGWTILVF